MGTVARLRAPDRVGAVHRVRHAQGTQPEFHGPPAGLRRTRLPPDTAQLIGFCPGCMYLVVDHPPIIGRRVVARFTLRGQPLGCAAGYVINQISEHGVTIGFHQMSRAVRELVDDVQRLRPALRAGFLRCLIDAHISVQ